MKRSFFLSKLQPKTLSATFSFIAIALVAAIGTYFLTTSHAAAPYTRVEAESGTYKGTASPIIDTTGASSNGTYVVFGGPPYTGPTETAIPVHVLDGDFYYYYAGATLNDGATYTADGVSVGMTQADPVVTSSSNLNEDRHSLMEIYAGTGGAAIEIGWEVDPHTANPGPGESLTPADTLPHLFISYWKNGTFICSDGFYCDGWVATSTSIYPGMALPVGPVGTFKILYQNGQWDLYYNNVEFGYFSGSVWGGAFTKLAYIQVYAEVETNSPASTCIQMGNGLSGTSPRAARFSNITLYDSSQKTAIPLNVFRTAPSTYNYGYVTATGFNIGGTGTC
jgi:hypothetical protein